MRELKSDNEYYVVRFVYTNKLIVKTKDYATAYYWNKAFKDGLTKITIERKIKKSGGK